MVQIHSPRPFFLESANYITRKSEGAPGPKPSIAFLIFVGCERSSFFEFIALQ